ncbi:MAG: hypothetical protein QF903_11175 [Planctomycetota bacterium]|nr:hypothetical protein [Planctomycetota bacterium]MDP6762353.1 hypothetical protein [Planctomycetota bacterium]MDP6990030.1 hypothetical protein [Planctomycetota bacterium]
MPRLAPLPLALACCVLAARSAAPASAAQEPTDARAEAAWRTLDADTRTEVIERFRLEVAWNDTFQNALLRFVLDGQERDPGLWPARRPAAHFDPATHAPRQPTPRRPLGADSARVKKQAERFFFRVPPRRLRSGWAYSYETRGLVREVDADDPDRLFANGLRGFPPDLDLAEALVERALDDGAQRLVLTAFGHAYTDRLGALFPGLTLYDAWASGGEMEMPDIDCLGIVHTVLDDWTSWKAPVPTRKQDELYATIGALFVDARRHRGLRHALARSYLTGEAVLRDGYQPSLAAFHALWEDASSNPATLAERLPPAADWEGFLTAWGERVDDEPERLAAGRRRQATLVADAAAVRRTLLRILRETGAFD